MSFNDDEPIVTPPNSGPRPKPIKIGKVQWVPLYKDKVPLEENTLQVLLELTGSEYNGDRIGLDLVAVLDVSGSMKDDDKIKKMKIAMQFVIKKLGPNDRLSIVTFSGAAAKLCPLRQITEASQKEVQRLIDGLKAGGSTNISEGLRIGLKVLAGRKLTDGRDVGVMLMSDGNQTEGDAAQVVIGKVPVHTFGFGKDSDPKVLTAVAMNSMGGTFSIVNDFGGLSMAFSQILAGLLTVVVHDLQLTVMPLVKSKIKKVTAGSYPQTPPDEAGSITVSFGDLYSREVRSVIVDVFLPADDVPDKNFDFLVVATSYLVAGDPEREDSPPRRLNVERTGTAPLGDDQAPEVQRELTRLETVTMIKAARTMADGKNLKGAQEELMKAQNALEDVVDQQSNPLVDNLQTELDQLLKLMTTQEKYEKEGRPYMLSSETSHDLQRFAARGNIQEMRLFATPRMNNYLEQAKKFDKDPTAPLPSVDEDVKEEVAANPLSSIAGPITLYIQTAIQALQEIGKLINNGGKR